MSTKVLLAVIMASIFCPLASGKPTHGPLGVPLTETGKMSVGVGGSTLRINEEGQCMDSGTVFWYATSEVKVNAPENRPGQCPFLSNGGIPIHNGDLPCPLKKNAEGMVDIDVVHIPTGCSVVLTNAYLPHKGDGEEGGSTLIYVAVFVPIGVLLILVIIGLVVYFVCVRPCLEERKAERAAAERMAKIIAELEEESVAAPLPAPTSSQTAVPSVPSTTAPSTVPVSSVTTPEKLKPPTPVKTPAVTPVATASVPASVATPKAPVAVPTKIPPVPDAPSTIDATLEDAPKRMKTARPPHWNDRAGQIGRGRIHESYVEIRNRGSKCVRPTEKSKSLRDSMNEHRRPIETAVESFGRHGLLDRFQQEEMLLSRNALNNGPKEFALMQARYNDDVVRIVDDREVLLLMLPLEEQFGAVEELKEEALTMLRKTGAEIPADGARATFTPATREFLAKPSTPTFVQMVAYAAEYGFLLPLQKPEGVKEVLDEYSVQVMLVVAFHAPVLEFTRRQALAVLKMQLGQLSCTYDAADFAKMIYPLRLIPVALAADKDFLEKCKLVKMPLPPKKKKRCRKEDMPATGPANGASKGTAKPDGKRKSRSRKNRSKGSRSTSKTSTEQKSNRD